MTGGNEPGGLIALEAKLAVARLSEDICVEMCAQTAHNNASLI